MTTRVENVVVHRAGLEVRLRRMDDDEFHALRAAARGESLAVVLEAAFDRGVAPERIAGWPAQWRRQGIIAGWRRPVAEAVNGFVGFDETAR